MSRIFLLSATFAAYFLSSPLAFAMIDSEEGFPKYPLKLRYKMQAQAQEKEKENEDEEARPVTKTGEKRKLQGQHEGPKEAKVAKSVPIIDLTSESDTFPSSLRSSGDLRELLSMQNETLRHLAVGFKLAFDGHKVKLKDAIIQYREIYPLDTRSDHELMTKLRFYCKGF